VRRDRVRDRNLFRVNARAALVFAGTAAVAAAVDGASGSLTTAPPALTLLAGAALVLFSLRAVSWRESILASVAGICTGLWLQSAAPFGPHDVRVRAPRGHIAADLFEALDSLDVSPSAFDGRTIAVSGTWMPPDANVRATVSRRVMSCCAADAVDVGFDVAPRGVVRSPAGAWVSVAGRVRVRLRDGDLRYEIDDAVVRPAAGH
jgi:hypothetical protein